MIKEDTLMSLTLRIFSIKHRQSGLGLGLRLTQCSSEGEMSVCDSTADIASVKLCNCSYFAGGRAVYRAMDDRHMQSAYKILEIH